MTKKGEGCTTQLSPNTHDSEAPCFPEVPDHDVLTRRNQFQVKRTIKEEKEQKKAQKGKGKGKGRGKGRKGGGKGGKGKKGSKGKGKAGSSKKHAKTQNKLRNSKRKAARKAKARRAALAHKNRKLSDSSSETQSPCDAEQHMPEETHASYQEQAQLEQTYEQVDNGSACRPTKKPSNSKGINRKTIKTSKKKSKVSKVSRRATLQKSAASGTDDTHEPHPQAARPKAKAKAKTQSRPKAKAKTQAKARARRAQVPAPAQDPADLGTGPEPAELAEPVVVAEPVAQPAMAENAVGGDQDEVDSVVAEAGDNVVNPLVDEFRAKAKSMYAKCYVPGNNCCVSDHLGEEMPQADGFQFSVYWTRKAVGVKILQSSLRESLRNRKNKYQQIAYFSGGTCSHVNIEAARLYVQELSRQVNAANGPDPSSAPMQALEASLKSARAQAFREVTAQHDQ
eukprot:s21_g32.t1